ncbi:RHS repeat domain-containing protein [Chitiniphilus shinanonensis]|uniref:RHS repeat domain-containing protein n=1 Tax=Chitiniphilus shinanonensis TaxID=553088 RepID=UPI0024E08D0B|nr:RHS repeat domain-containing protein [Chitiniphilus shinanonensis]
MICRHRQIERFTAQHGDSVLFQEQYTRNSVGQIVGKTVSGNGPSKTYSYRYDLAGRLIEVTQNGSVIGQYQYDAFGNLRQVTLASGGQLDYVIDGQGDGTFWGVGCDLGCIEGWK